MIRYINKQKAIDKALWLEFSNREKNESYGIIPSSKGDHFVVPTNHVSFNEESFEKLPSNYAEMTYSHIKEIAMDEDPLHFWEEIKGMISVMDGEILRYILHRNIPLEKFIRNELANRGHDENHQWCGFEKAEQIWLK